jgi:hypothetical protein
LLQQLDKCNLLVRFIQVWFQLYDPCI